VNSKSCQVAQTFIASSVPQDLINFIAENERSHEAEVAGIVRPKNIDVSGNTAKKVGSVGRDYKKKKNFFHRIIIGFSVHFV
jgi:hypothetical protein